MALRTFFVTDNDSLVVSSSSTVDLIGNGIINNSDTPDGTIFTYRAGGGTTVTLDDDDRFSDDIPKNNNLFFNDDDEKDHVITDGGGIVTTGAEVESESTIVLRALDAPGHPTGPDIEITVFSQGGVTQDVWGFASDTALVDGASYIKMSGDNNGTTRYKNFIPCFAADTQIRTKDGLVAAADIAVGDLVWTRDNGYQPVRWVGGTEVPAVGPFAPIVFAPGTMGNDTELVLSPEHRVLQSDGQTELFFGSEEVLVAAKYLCGLPGVTKRQGGQVHYVHFMFDQHQIVSANGAPCESFYLSNNALSGVETSQRRELLALYPSLAAGIASFGSTAAVTLNRFEVTVLRDHLAAQMH